MCLWCASGATGWCAVSAVLASVCYADIDEIQLKFCNSSGVSFSLCLF